VPTNTSKNFGRRNNQTLWDSFSVWEPGNTDNSQPSTESQSHLAQIKPEDWDTKLNKESSFKESELEEVAERNQSPRVLSTVSQPARELPSSNTRETTVLSLKKELAEDSVLSVSSTHTGLLKTPLTNSTKSSSSTHTTMPSETTQDLTGSPSQSTREENSEVRFIILLILIALFSCAFYKFIACLHYTISYFSPLLNILIWLWIWIGLTAAGKKGRGLRVKGGKDAKRRPSQLANWKRRNQISLPRYR